uniref:Fibronectin type-III domain-containing protein n=1 Tax=Amphimedon queenslandica TaxID=400682 RepID=A0A1X7UG89_AMPQE
MMQLILLLQLELLLFAFSSATVHNLACGDIDGFYCPNTTINFTCSISSASLQWESTAFSGDIEFFGSPIGTVRSNGLFTARLSDKTGNAKAVSVLSFPASVPQVNGSVVICRDLQDGFCASCKINIIYPSISLTHLNISAVQVSVDSVNVKWQPHHSSYSYTVTIVPCNATNAYCQRNSSPTIFTGLIPKINYTFTLRASSCMGSKEKAINFSLIHYRPFKPTDVTMCTIYSNDSYYVSLQWTYPAAQGPYHTLPLYFLVETIDDLRDVLYQSQASPEEDHMYISSLVPVPFNTTIHVNLRSVNMVGMSENTTIFTNASNRIFVEFLHIGTTTAFLKVIIKWPDSCSSIVTVMLSYKQMTNVSNANTEAFHYHLLTDQYGKIVFISDLQPDTCYYYSISVFNDTNQIAEPVEGEFRTQAIEDYSEIVQTTSHREKQTSTLLTNSFFLPLISTEDATSYKSYISNVVFLI